MTLTKKEIQQADAMIKSYKNTIKYIRSQIVEIERKKLKYPEIKKFDFKLVNRKIKK